MKRLVLTALALVLFPHLERPVLAQAANTQASPWKCYAGGHVGYGQGTATLENNDNDIDNGDDIEIAKGGALVGGEIGCDYTGVEITGIGPIVIGPVMDISFGGFSGEEKARYEEGFSNSYNIDYTAKTNRIINLRMRVGGVPAFNNDLFLYATTGYLWASNEINVDFGDGIEDEEEETLGGITLGFGGEFEPTFAKQWNGKIALEYQYASLGTDEIDEWEESAHLFRVVFRRYF